MIAMTTGSYRLVVAVKVFELEEIGRSAVSVD